MAEHAEQPMPVPNDRPSVQGMVRADLELRERVGIQRYGTALQAHNGRDALRDAYEEALDLACYLRQAIEERGAFTGVATVTAERVQGGRTDPGAGVAPPEAVETISAPLVCRACVFGDCSKHGDAMGYRSPQPQSDDAETSNRLAPGSRAPLKEIPGLILPGQANGSASGQVGP